MNGDQQIPVVSPTEVTEATEVKKPEGTEEVTEEQAPASEDVVSTQ